MEEYPGFPIYLKKRGLASNGIFTGRARAWARGKPQINEQVNELPNNSSWKYLTGS